MEPSPVAFNGEVAADVARSPGRVLSCRVGVLIAPDGLHSHREHNLIGDLLHCRSDQLGALNQVFGFQQIFRIDSSFRNQLSQFVLFVCHNTFPFSPYRETCGLFCYLICVQQIIYILYHNLHK